MPCRFQTSHRACYQLKRVKYYLKQNNIFVWYAWADSFYFSQLIISLFILDKKITKSSYSSAKIISCFKIYELWSNLFSLHFLLQSVNKRYLYTVVFAKAHLQADRQRGAAELTITHRQWSGELSNCFSINQLVGQNIISKNQTETSVKREFSAIIFNLNVDSFRY